MDSSPRTAAFLVATALAAAATPATSAACRTVGIARVAFEFDERGRLPRTRLSRLRTPNTR